MKKSFKFIFGLALASSLLVGCNNQNSSNNTSITTSYDDISNVVHALEYARNHDVGLEGKVYTVYDDGGNGTDIASFDIHNIFNEGLITSTLTYHYEIDDKIFDDVYEATYFKKEDGYTYKRGLTLKNEVLDEAIVSNKTGDKLKFDEHFASPFKTLKYANLVQIKDSYLIKPQIATSFVTSLTQQNVVAKKALLKVNDGKFTSLEIHTSSSSSMISGVSASYRFEINFNWDEKGAIPEVKPYEHLENHSKLEDALASLNYSLKNNNYTVNTEATIDNSTINYQYYVTEDASYSTLKDSSKNTYGIYKEGTSFYEFACDESGKISKYEDPVTGNIYPSYTSFAPELFQVKDEHTFVLRNGFESSVLALIAPYIENSYYVTYVNELEIHLNSDNQFECLYFEYYDYVNNISAKNKITYKDIGNTELPIII